MSGVGRCRDCSERIFWGDNPNGSGRAFPFDDPTHVTPHFSTCRAIPRIRDPWTGDEVRVSRCGYCHQSIWWRTTYRGQRQPMNLQADGSASMQTHFDTCSGSPSRRAWTGQDWVEPDPVFRASATPTSALPIWRRALDQHLQVLELSWPCSPVDVRQAYRRLSLSRHPDHGGTAQAFIQLKSAHDEAVAVLDRLGATPMA